MRYMRNKLPHCLGCGSEKFTSTMEDKIVVISDVPKEGFHIHTNSEERQLLLSKNSMIKSIIVFIPLLLLCLFCFITKIMLSLYLFFLFPVFVISGLYLIFEYYRFSYNKKELKKLEYLKYHGVLYKNEYFKLRNFFNHKYVADVSFREDNNSKATKITSKPMIATEFFYEDSFVDVLVNPNNKNEYYIGFDIY